MLTMAFTLGNSVDDGKTKRTDAIRGAQHSSMFLSFVYILKFFCSLLMYIYGRGQGRRLLHHPHHPHGPFPVDPLLSCSPSFLTTRDFSRLYAISEKGFLVLWAGQFQSS